MDLETSYLGLTLKNPIVGAASPLSHDIDTARKLEDAGASAIVMYSLFEEQIVHEQHELDHFLSVGNESFAEALSYFPEPEEFVNIDAEEYLEQITKLKQALDIPVIASLNGTSKGGWRDYASRMREAGADAIELNVYYVPTDTSLTAEQVEAMYLDNVTTVKKAVDCPVALKVGPFFSAFSHFAVKASEAGADGLVLFNRFFGPEIDLDDLEVVPKLKLSTRAELQLPLRWIAVLYGHLKADMAASSGVHTAEDVLKLVMAGASVTQIASTLLINGVDHVSQMLSEMTHWMEEREYDSIAQMRGSMSYQAIAEPSAYERANYMKTLHSWE